MLDLTILSSNEKGTCGLNVHDRSHKIHLQLLSFCQLSIYQSDLVLVAFLW